MLVYWSGFFSPAGVTYPNHRILFHLITLKILINQYKMCKTKMWQHKESACFYSRADHPNNKIS
jgi:hypothetical protein